jgi:hypothetical protein
MGMAAPPSLCATFGVPASVQLRQPERPGWGSAPEYTNENNHGAALSTQSRWQVSTLPEWLIC